MIRRLVLVSALVLAAPAAMPETLAKSVESSAKSLLPAVQTLQTAAVRRAALPAEPLDAGLVSRLQRFAMDTSALSRDADAAGVIDLRCIFRGMTEETGVQLDALERARTGTDQAAAYGRLIHMLRDAVEIAPAAEGAVAPSNRPPGKCKP